MVTLEGHIVLRGMLLCKGDSWHVMALTHYWLAAYSSILTMTTAVANLIVVTVNQSGLITIAMSVGYAPYGARALAKGGREENSWIYVRTV